MNIDWSFVLNTVLPALLEGLVVTIEATVLGSILAFILGLVFAVFLRSAIWLRAPTRFFVEFVRSTPLLVQLYVFFYVLPEYGIQLPAFITGVIALGLHFSTYIAEVYRSGIDGVPMGQWEACTSLSLPGWRTWTSVVLPQAIPRVVPALGNYVIMMFKYTPLLSAITVLGLVGEAKIVGARNFAYVAAFTLAGIFFLVLSYTSGILVRMLERRLGHT